MAYLQDHAPSEWAAVVWIDRWHASVAKRSDGHPAIVDVLRDDETESAYVNRVAALAQGCGRLMILGPDDERLELDRACLLGHPDLFVDVEGALPTTPAELFDRLRLLEGDELARPRGG